MRRTQLPLGGYLSVFAFVASVAAGAFWFDANSAAQAGTGNNVIVQAVIAHKTTVHRPISATTNGLTVRRMENSYIVTLAFQDGRDPPLKVEQHVTGDFFHTVANNAPVRVTIDPDNATITDITPGVIADPTRFLTTFALGFIFLGLGLAAVIWRRKTFEQPNA